MTGGRLPTPVLAWILTHRVPSELPSHKSCRIPNWKRALRTYKYVSTVKTGVGMSPFKVIPGETAFTLALVPKRVLSHIGPMRSPSRKASPVKCMFQTLLSSPSLGHSRVHQHTNGSRMPSSKETDLTRSHVSFLPFISPQALY